MTHRTLEAIGVDFSRLMKQGAELQYQIYALKKTLDNVNAELEKINLEANALPKGDQDAQTVQ